MGFRRFNSVVVINDIFDLCLVICFLLDVMILLVLYCDLVGLFAYWCLGALLRICVLFGWCCLRVVWFSFAVVCDLVLCC